MKKLFLAFCFLALLGLWQNLAAQQGRDALSLRSPDGKVEVAFRLDPDGAPVYTVGYGGAEIVKPSALGLVFKQGGALARGLTVTKVERRRRDEAYTLVVGKTREARDRYQEMTISLREAAAPRRELRLIFRAYDDGAAFRYALPEQTGLKQFEITDELSEFRFAPETIAWAMQFKSPRSNYEKEFERTTLAAIKPEPSVALPVTMRTPAGTAVALAEADLENYAGMYLRAIEGAPGALRAQLSPLKDGDGVCVRASAPLESPWRVVMLAPDPSRLIESTLVLNLNDPSAILDTSWIKPGKASWDWWSGQTVEGAAFKSGMNDETMRRYIDLAADLKLEYMLLDAGWYTPKAYGDDADYKADITKSVPEIDLPALVRYGRERNVGIVVWLHWIPTRDQMDKAFPYYESIGVRGVKVDFMDRDDQEMVAFYHRVLKTAAEHKLVVDLHGAYKPTGLVRKYPNYLTQEGVMGAEYNKWSKRITASHNVTLPFTRMLVGPMDYTPGGFRNVTPAAFVAQDKMPMVMTTRAHGLAMYVVYESPFACVSDSPGAYKNGSGKDQPGTDFLRVVPTTWDETRVIQGAIGESIIIARRRGREWFVGAMTNEQGRELTLPLSFLGKGEYAMTGYADGADAARDPAQLSTETKTVRAGERVTLRLAPSGGFAAHLRPAK